MRQMTELAAKASMAITILKTKEHRIFVASPKYRA